MTSKYSNFAVKLISCGLWFHLSFEHFYVSIIDMIYGYRFVILGIFGKFGI